MSFDSSEIRKRQAERGSGAEKGQDGARAAKPTRAERKEATLDDLRAAADELKSAAASAQAAQRKLAERASAIEAGVAVLTGQSGDPAEYYREHLRESFDEAAAEIDFYGVAKQAVDDLANGARGTLQEAQEASASMKRAWDSELVRRHVVLLTRAVAAAAIILAVACAGLTAACFVKLEPVFTGKAVVSYEPGYESELDRTRLELAFARNELDAYRRQYPLGIGETAQADLDAANRAAQEIYDADHAG